MKSCIYVRRKGRCSAYSAAGTEKAVSGNEDLIIIIIRFHWERITAAAGCWAERSRRRGEERDRNDAVVWRIKHQREASLNYFEGVVGCWECDWHVKKIWSKSPTPCSAFSVAALVPPSRSEPEPEPALPPSSALPSGQCRQCHCQANLLPVSQALVSSSPSLRNH